jgi:hypothetical protein
MLGVLFDEALDPEFDELDGQTAGRSVNCPFKKHFHLVVWSALPIALAENSIMYEQVRVEDVVEFLT